MPAINSRHFVKSTTYQKRFVPILQQPAFFSFLLLFCSSSLPFRMPSQVYPFNFIWFSSWQNSFQSYLMELHCKLMKAAASVDAVLLIGSKGSERYCTKKVLNVHFYFDLTKSYAQLLIEPWYSALWDFFLDCILCWRTQNILANVCFHSKAVCIFMFVCFLVLTSYQEGPTEGPTLSHQTPKH